MAERTALEHQIAALLSMKRRYSHNGKERMSDEIDRRIALLRAGGDAVKSSGSGEHEGS